MPFYFRKECPLNSGYLTKPGTLNDFLIAPDEGDLKPDVVKRFEEMVVQAQQSAGAAAGNAQQTAQDVARQPQRPVMMHNVLRRMPDRMQPSQLRTERPLRKM